MNEMGVEYGQEVGLDRLSRLSRCVAMRLLSSILMYSPLTRLPTGRRSPRAGKTVTDKVCAGMRNKTALNSCVASQSRWSFSRY